MTEKNKQTELLLEQYKLYVQMADNVSSRRAQANAFYISMITGLLAILSFSLEEFSSYAQYTILLAVGILGVLLCFVWRINISSYKSLNSGKFTIIHDMEKNLPYACFEKEWELLGRGEDSNSYLALTKIEGVVPFLLMAPFIILVAYSISQLR